MMLPRILPAVIAGALLVAGAAGCSFSVKKPDTFSTVDAKAEDGGVDVAQSEDVPADVGPECTSDEQCAEIHGPAPECLERYCKEGGNCGVKSAPPGTPCGEPDECFVTGICAAGKCETSQPVDVCDDDDQCTDDHCVPGDGCQHKEKQCDDNDPCTGDLCDPEVGCVHQQAPDCPPKCVETGGQYFGAQHDETCCSGATSAPLWKEDGETGVCPPDGPCEVEPICKEVEDVWVCTDCHDGECEEWEDFCLCPKDCAVIEPPPQNDCVLHGGLCEPAVPVPEEMACPEGWQIDHNYYCDEDEWCCMPGPPAGCDCPDDDFHFCGPDEECLPCFAEVCGDGWDNDCDGDTDESNCFSSDSLLSCLGQVDGGPTKISVHKLVHFPDAFAGKLVVTAGRAVAADCSQFVEGPVCPLYLFNKQGEQIPLTGSNMGMDVGCLPDVDGAAGKCHPLSVPNKYFVWGKWTWTDNDEGLALHLEGYCGD